MNTISRIRVNLSSREFEVEGTEEFVRSYGSNIQSFLEELSKKPSEAAGSTTNGTVLEKLSKSVSSDGVSVIKAKKPGKAAKEIVKLNPNLNLRGDGQIGSFKDFLIEKKPKKGPEFNAVSVYYLQEQMGLSQVTLSDAFTCYKEVGQRPTENFKQAFIDTKNKKGWVEIDENGNLSMTARGSILVEHDLPAKSIKA